TKGKVPLKGGAPKGERKTYRSGGSGGGDGNGRQVCRRSKTSWTWKRWTWVTLLALFILLVIWSVAGYLSVSSGVADANKRLPANTAGALKKQNSLIFSSSTNILLLGTDHSTNGQA